MLPTLPYQQTNRYAVVDIMSLILSQTRVVYLFTSRRIYKFTHLQTNKLNRLFILPPFHLSKGEAIFSPFHPFIFPKAEPSFHPSTLSPPQRRGHLFTLPPFHLHKGEAIFSPFQPFTFTKAKPSFHPFNLSPSQRRSHLFTLSTFHLPKSEAIFSPFQPFTFSPLPP